MAKIITLLAEATTRTILQAKLTLGQWGLYTDDEKLLAKDRSGNEYDFSSDQHITKPLNDYAQVVGLASGWGGTASNVRDALGEVYGGLPSTVESARGFQASNSTVVTVPANTTVNVTWDTTEEDVNGLFDGTVFTPDLSGTYQFNILIGANIIDDELFVGEAMQLMKADETAILKAFVSSDYVNNSSARPNNFFLSCTAILVAGTGYKVKFANGTGAGTSTHPAELHTHASQFSAYKVAEVVTVAQGGGALLWEDNNGTLQPVDPATAVYLNGTTSNPNTLQELNDATTRTDATTILLETSNQTLTEATLNGVVSPVCFSGGASAKIGGAGSYTTTTGAIVSFIGGANFDVGAGISLILGDPAGAPMNLVLNGGAMYVKKLKLVSNVTLTTGVDFKYEEVDLNGFTLTGGTKEIWYSSLQGGGTSVTSVFGRVGVVVSAFADYIAGQIGFSPSSYVTSIDVQGAVGEVIAKTNTNTLLANSKVASVSAGTGGVTVTGGATTPTINIPSAPTYIAPRIGSIGSTTGLTINADAVDQFNVTALAQNITVNAPSGTPVDGQILHIRLDPTLNSLSITMASGVGAFRYIGVDVIPVTVAGKLVYVGCKYNATDDLWDILATGIEG